MHIGIRHLLRSTPKRSNRKFTVMFHNFLSLSIADLRLIIDWFVLDISYQLFECKSIWIGNLCEDCYSSLHQNKDIFTPLRLSFLFQIFLREGPRFLQGRGRGDDLLDFLVQTDRKWHQRCRFSKNFGIFYGKIFNKESENYSFWVKRKCLALFPRSWNIFFFFR